MYSNCDIKGKRVDLYFSKMYKSNKKTETGTQHVENRSGEFAGYGVEILSIMFAFWTLIFMFHTRHIAHTLNNQDGQGR